LISSRMCCLSMTCGNDSGFSVAGYA
jgi:hypothetical protein